RKRLPLNSLREFLSMLYRVKYAQRGGGLA
ncbi:MAG: hypothetical protein RL398_619, partial [Planctomycetota bacterium]